MPFETIHSETVFSGRVFRVRLDQVRLPDGRQVRLDIVEHRGAVTLVPVDNDGQIWFVRQYRHPAETILLELPAGVMEESEGPEASALRELREEIGMAAGSLQKIGEFFLAPGYSTEYMYVYLATGLHPDPLPGDEDELIEIEKIPIQRAYALIREGVYRDSKTLATLLLAQPYLNVK
jgi:ADP-ribose pyrophosphatase